MESILDIDNGLPPIRTRCSHPEGSDGAEQIVSASIKMKHTKNMFDVFIWKKLSLSLHVMNDIIAELYMGTGTDDSYAGTITDARIILEFKSQDTNIVFVSNANHERYRFLSAQRNKRPLISGQSIQNDIVRTSFFSPMFP
jgi:hypothetical protein